MVEQPPTPPGRSSPRNFIMAAIAVLVIALIGTVAYNRFLVPAPHSSDLNSNKVEGGKDLSRR
ncbi:hypothetical protein [Hansschlegelia zhihuaiae]|uniref:Uncharacterized protein n=1 Tax=Hansschlegelia zhihuaiae TaxID=405005 RepID=A0A4Q0M429_9HYPH|nr:hypothetical protein [Hansschlegelia zhihuaiae]RXF67698.1 hypothetical protein EK403_21080 [Hansschlegelia zhihuaiae]